ncbi:MAG: transpeptidase family protein [Bacteroidales bacterium]|nr:transpeptidase family protein [Bacteroidales bacterium]
MMSIKTDILWRVALVYLAIALFAALIVVKIIVLQFVNDDRYRAMAEQTRIQLFNIPAHRGDIYAADMRLLASSVPSYEIRMDLKCPGLTNDIFLDGADSLALCLSELFHDKSKSEYKQQLLKARQKGDRYHLIRSKVNYIELKELRSFPIFREGRYKGGLIVNQQNIRKKPHYNLAARTIGYTTKGQSGNIVGIEGAYDKYLAGIQGVKRMQKLSGNVWMPLDESGEIEPQDGSSIVTTIDVDLQDIAEKALIKQLIAHRAHAGTAVLMEVRSGDIKAIVNLTDTFGAYHEYYNYAVGLSTEPGSTFKLPVIVTALEDGLIDIDDTINTGNGIYEYYDLVIRDDNYLNGGHGKLTVEEVFEISSNIGMVKIIDSVYRKHPHRFIDRLYSMSLNEPLNLEIKGEGKPVIRYPGDKLWSGVTLASMSYGYEVKLTPLQILTFYNAIANDGKMVKPRFVKEIRNHGKLEQAIITEVINPSICSKSTLKMAKKLLRGVVDNGTAKNLKLDNLSFAGKTGTAQIYKTETGYRQRDYQASFAGYFPEDKPLYSCIVVIYSPRKGSYHGAQVAGPVFAEIARKTYAISMNSGEPLNAVKIQTNDLPYSKNGYQAEISDVLNQLNIKQKSKDQSYDWVTTTRQEDCVELNKKSVLNNLVPDVTSMGLKDAIYLLENLGLKVVIYGRGSIREQSILPGTRVQKGDVIKLKMSFTEG